MSDNTTPLSESLHIVIAGNTNAGKSSLFNALFRNDVAVVSSAPGTTTDPVTRKIELSNLGPCSITDTAGLDDTTELGAQRIKKSHSRITTADLVLFATPSNISLTEDEKTLLSELTKSKIPVIAIFTFDDKKDSDFLNQKEDFFKNAGCKTASFSATENTADYVSKIYKLIEETESKIARELTPVEGIVCPGSTVILVTPIDSAAPKGRLILPQIETLRDLLDRDCNVIVVKENGLERALKNLKNPPDLVITDSQAFAQVAKILPPEQPLTSFSILFARKKGDFEYFMKSLSVLENFPDGGKVLIMEACAHHQKDDDIGTVKIPNIFKKKICSGGKSVTFEWSREIPENIKDFALVIHCGACMITQKTMLERTALLKAEGIPAINYGLFLAWANGLLPRAIEPVTKL